MGRRKHNENPEKDYELPAYTSEEALENAMIAKATQLAYKQLCDGTASSQVITHFLKLGSTKERIEREILEKQKDLISAKTESLNNAKNSEKLYKEAIDAFKLYSGKDDKADEEDIF
jgi:hypothetical protein